MPKIVSYTPSWLSRPSPGSKIFTDPSPDTSPEFSKRLSLNRLAGDTTTSSSRRPPRLLAQRGQEIFVVIGNQIRWSDLLLEQSQWEARRWDHGESLRSSVKEPSYRILTVPIHHQIRRLVVSPSGFFLAILTQHTVHVACLPDSTLLRSGDRASIKLKTYQLGPTTHVIPQSPVVAALWHPFAASTSTEDCFVTITADAAVRMWELDRNSRWTFDEPALAVDLRKLIDGSSCDQDFRPLGFNISRGFSADLVDMEVSSACFGGQGDEEEDGWAAMTLWIVMRTGDVYALCPLLPSKWVPSQTTISSLSTSVVSQMADLEATSSDIDSQKATHQQFKWVQELDNADPIVSSAASGPENADLFEIRSRPLNPSVIPRLQGPFQFDAEDDSFGLRELEASDIFVASPKVTQGDLDVNDSGQAEGAEGLPATVVCLVTSDQRLLVCLSLEGVQGEWLPKTANAAFTIPSSIPKDLILIETHNFTSPKPGANGDSLVDWPVVTAEFFSRYDFYVTSSDFVYYVSLLPWVSRLDKELGLDSSDEGLAFRVEVACRDNIALPETLLACESDSSPFSACESFYHDDFGYLLLSFKDHQPHALILDLPHTHPDSCTHSPTLRAITAGVAIPDSPISIDLPPTRPAYQPPQSFYTSPAASLTQLRSRVPPRYRQTLTSEIRLSPSTLEIFTRAHRALSKETHALELSAAQLFLRVERLRSELKEQIMQMVNVSEKLQGILKDGEDIRVERGNHEERVQKVDERQLALTRRWDGLRRKLGKAELLGRQGRELSVKEKGWISEVETLATSFGVTDDKGDQTEAGAHDESNGAHESHLPRTSTLGTRCNTVIDLSSTLLPEARRIISQQQLPSSMTTGKDAITLTSTINKSSPDKMTSPSLSRSDSAAASSVPPKLQKANVTDVMSMVEREGAVIEAAMKRLERLKLDGS